MPSLLSTLSLLLLLLLLPRSALAVTELDGTTLWALISDSPEKDVLIFFINSRAAAAPLRAHTEALSRRLGLGAAGGAFSLALYDVPMHGWPSGLHVHMDAEGDSAVILFPAGGREPHRYDFAHDPLSYSPGGGGGSGGDGAPPYAHRSGGLQLRYNTAAPPEGDSHAAQGHDHGHDHSHGHDHGHDHEHALAPTLAGTLRWLRSHASYPEEVPTIGVAEIWEGREDGLFSAVLTGLEALHKRMEALQRENAELRGELKACKK